MWLKCRNYKFFIAMNVSRHTDDCGLQVAGFRLQDVGCRERRRLCGFAIRTFTTTKTFEKTLIIIKKSTLPFLEFLIPLVLAVLLFLAKKEVVSPTLYVAAAVMVSFYFSRCGCLRAGF